MFGTELGVSYAPPGVIIVSPRASLVAPRGFRVHRRCLARLVPRGTETLCLDLARKEWQARTSRVVGCGTTRERRMKMGKGAASRLRE